MWREDLRKELGCEPITSIETMEAYAEAVLKSGNGMIPFCDTGAGGLWHTMLEKEHIYTEFGSPFNTLALDLDTDEIVDYATLDGVQEMCETQRKWEKMVISSRMLHLLRIPEVTVCFPENMQDICARLFLHMKASSQRLLRQLIRIGNWAI